MVMKYRPKQEIQTVFLNLIILKHYKTFKLTGTTDLDSMINEVMRTGHFNDYTYQQIKTVIYDRMLILKKGKSNTEINSKDEFFCSCIYVVLVLLVLAAIVSLCYCII